MGLMKFLHTKQTEGSALVGAERKFVEATAQAEFSVTPEYSSGPDGKLILGFPDAAIDQFEKSRVLYFISWSVNFKDFNVFREQGGIYRMPKHRDAKEGKGLIPVTIDGPYDAKGLTDQHLPCSPYKSLAEVELGMANWGRHDHINTSSYPLFLWRATRA